MAIRCHRRNIALRYLLAAMLVCLAACTTSGDESTPDLTEKSHECREYAASLLNINRKDQFANLALRDRLNIEIDYIIRCHKIHIYKLFTDATHTPLNPAGEVKLQLSINKNGAVTAIKVDSTNIQDKTFLNKLIAYLQQLQFNQARNDGIYPYTLDFAE